MIRAGARAPQPPPLPPSPSPKPRHTRAFEQSKERLLHRGRRTEDLRDKVVQLARQKEETIHDQHDVITGRTSEGSSPRHLIHGFQGESAGEGHSATVAGVRAVVYDLSKEKATTGLGSSAPNAAPAGERKGFGPTLHARRGWEKITLTDLSSNANLQDEASAERPTTLVGSEKLPPQPDSPPFPRPPARGFRQTPHQAVIQTAGTSPRLVNAPQTTHLGGNVGGPGTTRQGRGQEGKVQFDSPSGKPTSKSSKTQSRTCVHQVPSDLHPRVTPQSANGARADGFIDIKHDKDIPKEASSKETSGEPNSHEIHRQKGQQLAHDRHPPSPPDPHSSARRPQRLNYTRAARYLHASLAPAPPPGAEPHKRVRLPLGQERRGPRPKSVKLRADECSSHYQSSGSSGDSPRQTSRGVEAVGEVRGSALHSPSHCVHTPLSPHRHDNKNPSRFPSSLEMFKRRLKMNQINSAKENTQVEEDYVIRLGDTVTTQSRHPTQHARYVELLDPHPPNNSRQNCHPLNADRDPRHDKLETYPDIGLENTRGHQHVKPEVTDTTVITIDNTSQTRDQKLSPANHSAADWDHKKVHGDSYPRIRDNKFGQTDHGLNNGGNKLGQTDNDHGNRDNKLGQNDCEPKCWDNKLGRINHDLRSRDNEFGQLSPYSRERDEKPREMTDLAMESWKAGPEERKAKYDMEEEEESEMSDEDQGYDCTLYSRLPDSVDDLTYVPPGDAARTPLPQVKTYVLEEDKVARAQGRGLDRGHTLALTQHNVIMHNTFLYRHEEQEKLSKKQAEFERKAGLLSRGGGGGGGGAGGGGRGGGGAAAGWPNTDSRMQQWLVETERQQRDFQPMFGNAVFKIAIAAT